MPKTYFAKVAIIDTNEVAEVIEIEADHAIAFLSADEKKTLMEAVEEIEANQFKDTDNRANAHVAEVQAVDVEVLVVKLGGPIGGGGHNASAVNMEEVVCLLMSTSIREASQKLILWCYQTVDVSVDVFEAVFVFPSKGGTVPVPTVDASKTVFPTKGSTVPTVDFSEASSRISSTLRSSLRLVTSIRL